MTLSLKKRTGWGGGVTVIRNLIVVYIMLVMVSKLPLPVPVERWRRVMGYECWNIKLQVALGGEWSD